PTEGICQRCPAGRMELPSGRSDWEVVDRLSSEMLRFAPDHGCGSSTATARRRADGSDPRLRQGPLASAPAGPQRLAPLSGCTGARANTRSCIIVRSGSLRLAGRRALPEGLQVDLLPGLELLQVAQVVNALRLITRMN